MNGGFPHRIIYMVAPSAQTSASCPEYPAPEHSSGLMNVGVPVFRRDSYSVDDGRFV